MVVTTNRYQKTLNATDFGLTSDVTLTRNKWVLVAEYTVPAQQEIAVGATQVINGGATGRVGYIRLDHTDGNQITGNIRVKVVDANDEGGTVLDHSHSEWSADQTDRNKGLLIQEDFRRAQEDSKIQIWIYQTSGSGTDAATVDASDANTIVQVPVTVYTLRKG